MLQLTSILDLHHITEDFFLIKQNIFRLLAVRLIYACIQNATDLIQIQIQGKHPHNLYDNVYIFARFILKIHTRAIVMI